MIRPQRQQDNPRPRRTAKVAVGMAERRPERGKIEDPVAPREEPGIRQAAVEAHPAHRRESRTQAGEAPQRYFRHFDLAPVGMVRLNEQAMILEANLLGAKMLGFERARPGPGKIALSSCLSGDSQRIFRAHLRSAFASREVESCEVTLRQPSGEETPVRMQSVASVGADGAKDLLVTLTDLSERQRAESERAESERKLTERFAAFRDRQIRVLEQLAAGASLTRNFEALVQMIEEQSPETIASVLVLDADGVHLRHGAAPGLPAEYSRAIEGVAIGPCVGSCGTAACRGQRVIVSDIATDPLWANFKELALQHGLRSCWSEPIFCSQGKVLGTFAMYHRHICEPGEEDLQIIRVAAHLAGIAIERQRTEEARQAAERERELTERENFERKQIEAAVRESEERYVLAEEATNDGIWDWNPATGADYLSPRWKALLGFARDELRNEKAPFFSRIHPEDLPAVREALRRHLEEGQPYCVELRLRGKDGSYRWFVSRGQASRDEAGRVVRMVGAISDITGRRQAEEELKLMTNRLLLATRAAAIGVWDFDPINNVLIWDDQMFRVFGITRDCFSGTYEAWQATVHPEDLPREIEKVGMALRGEQEFDSEFRVIWPDKSIHHIKANASVQRDAAGKAVHMIGTNWDITEQKRAAEELARTVAELGRSNADLARFASIASHDLQEPLRAVAGCVELLEKRSRDQLDASAGELIQHIAEGTRRMQTLIRDLLEYSRVGTRGKRFEPTDCAAALERALANLATAIRESGAVITHDPLPTLLADPTQLTQLFQNLIGNAVKFCQERRPEIHVGARPEKGGWMLSVRDHGIGIEPEFRERIFVIFQRLHTRAEYSGTGIGLAICQRIVERHGGRIWVESEPGEGSTFYFTIPKNGNPGA